MGPKKRLFLDLFVCAVSLVFGAFPVWPAQTVGENVRLREAKVAGQFYPDDAKELRSLIQELLGRQPDPTQKRKPRALIVPHAGYQYSGLIAANAYRQLKGTRYDGVVVVGFTHQAHFSGSSVDKREAYATPLGEIPVHQEAAAVLRTYPGVDYSETAYSTDEHSLEVQLPFLQVVLGKFRLVPVIMGGAGMDDANRLAAALRGLSKTGDYLFVFSTDLSHYHGYDEANQIDERTINALLQETPQAVDRLFERGRLEACGRGPIVSSLFLASKLGYLKRELLYHANSGDTWGTANKVVGYAAIALYETDAKAPGRISKSAGNALVKAARTAIDMELKPGKYKNRLVALWPGDGIPAEISKAKNGVFVTLRTRNNELRGCIGRIQSTAPLASTLPLVAADAALRDGRFSPVTPAELDDLHVEVSVLTPPVAVSGAEAIVPGRDGVILESQSGRGVFLPQVWDETGWTKVEFLRELSSQKAGLSPDAWQNSALYTFQAQIFEE